jgi:tetratricopeptide (TPR) repeat protein
MKKLLVLLFIALHSSFFTLCIAQNKYVDSLKTVLIKSNNPFERFNLINKIAQDHYVTGNGAIDSSYAMQMLHIALQVNNDSLKAISYNWIGNYYLQVGADFSKALEFFLKGVPLAEKAKDKRRLSSLYFDISNLYYLMDNPAEELNYAKKGEASLPDKSSPIYNFMVIQLNGLMYQYYSVTGKPDSTLHYLHALNELNYKTKSPFWEAETMGKFGLFYEQAGDYALADAYFKKAIRIADSNKDFYSLCSFKNKFAGALLKQNRLEDAKSEAMESFVRSKRNKYNTLNQKAAGLLQNIFYKLKNTDSAYYYSRMESTMRDSIFNTQKMNKMQSMAFTEQLRISEEEAKQAEEKEKQRQNIQYALIALGIVTLLILFLVLVRSVVIHEKLIEVLGVIALLIVFEFLNLILHPFFGKITNENPLLMLLALVCIAGLLVPMHHRIEKWATHRLIEKNKQIRLTAGKKTIEKLEDKKPTV